MANPHPIHTGTGSAQAARRLAVIGAPILGLGAADTAADWRHSEHPKHAPPPNAHCRRPSRQSEGSVPRCCHDGETPRWNRAGKCAANAGVTTHRALNWRVILQLSAPPSRARAEEVALADVQAIVAQDVVSRRHVKKEVRQGKSQEIILALEFHLTGTDRQ